MVSKCCTRFRAADAEEHHIAHKQPLPLINSVRLQVAAQRGLF